MQCHPEKASFAMGEPLVFRCVVSNTTDFDKRMTWYLKLGNQFHFATDETNWFGGLVPEVALQIRPPVKLEPSAILLPPHSSLSL